MRALIFAVACWVFIWLLPTNIVGSPVYSRRTNKDCTYCHPATNYNLTDAGKYYQQHKTLKGYQPKEDQKKDEKKKDQNKMGTTAVLSPLVKLQLTPLGN